MEIRAIVLDCAELPPREEGVELKAAAADAKPAKDEKAVSEKAAAVKEERASRRERPPLVSVSLEGFGVFLTAGLQRPPKGHVIMGVVQTQWRGPDKPPMFWLSSWSDQMF